MKDQKKIGVLLSYVNIAMSMGINIILVPMLITGLTDTDYGIYRVMQSFAGPLIMFNLGLSTIAARCVAKFRATDNQNVREKENTLALTVTISVLMSAVVVIIGLVMMGSIDVIFAKTISGENLGVAKKVFLIFIFSTALHIINDMFRGCVLGNEKFAFFYGTTTAQYIMRFSIIFTLLKTGFGVIAVTFVDFFIGIVLLIANIIYIKCFLHEKFKFHYFDKAEIISIFSFSASILLQAIVNQVNNNLDNVILGATVTNAVVITMYSSALSIYAIYNSLMTVLVNIFFPKATFLITKNSSGEQLTDFVIKAGRMQVMLALAVLGGFSLFGKDFICLWIGEKYLDAYYVALMLMIPVTIPLVQNVCLSILDAKLKRLFRSVVLVIMAIANAVASLILVNFIGFWGAAIGTVVSLILGHGIVMNIYYHKVIGLNVIRMFKEMFKGFLPAGLISVLCCIPLTFIPNNIVWFAVKCLGFVCVYGLWLWLIGFNKEEKGYFLDFINKKAT